MAHVRLLCEVLAQFQNSNLQTLQIAYAQSVTKLMFSFIKLFPDRSAVENLGYSIGAARWLKASGPDDAQAKTRGRPSKVNSKACIEAVRAVLQAHSQDSSKICRSNPGGTAEWVIARTLTKDRTALFEDEPSLYENMSARTMHRIMKEHLCHFKKARCQSDYCQYCADYDDKVLPQGPGDDS